MATYQEHLAAAEARQAFEQTVDEAAVAQFVAPAASMSAEMLRTVLARMDAMLKGSERPAYNGKRVSTATLQAARDQLAAMVQ